MVFILCYNYYYFFVYLNLNLNCLIFRKKNCIISWMDGNRCLTYFPVAVGQGIAPRTHARLGRRRPQFVLKRGRIMGRQAGTPHTAHNFFFLELTAHHIALPVADLPPLTSSARLFCLAAVVHVKQHPCFLFEKNHHSFIDWWLEELRYKRLQAVTATIPFYVTHDKPNL